MYSDIVPPGKRKKPPAKKPHHPVARPMPSMAALERNRMPKPDVTIELKDDGSPKSSSKKFSRIRDFRPHRHWYDLNRAEKWITVAGELLIIMTLAGCIYALVTHNPRTILPSKITHTKKAPVDNRVPAPLTGLLVDPSLVKRPVTGIMIENSLDARPQSGLQDAGVVFEAIAEAGITRFVALFQDTQPSYIGPVRSLRPYYIDFFTPFDASIAHVGGSPDALAQIRNGGKDLDQFFNSGAYWRQSTRPAPHNVYTSFDRLDALNSAKGYTSSNPTTWPRKKDQPLKTPSAKSIDVTISSADYNVHYDYDAKSNSYLRSEGGQPHTVTTSANDVVGVQLKPKVVVVPIIGLSNGELDASGAYYSNYDDTGSGTVYIFQDGGVTQGTWSKADRSDQFHFKDNSGNDIKLNAGQTWVTITSDSSKVTYSP